MSNKTVKPFYNLGYGELIRMFQWSCSKKHLILFITASLIAATMLFKPHYAAIGVLFLLGGISTLPQKSGLYWGLFESNLALGVLATQEYGVIAGLIVASASFGTVVFGSAIELENILNCILILALTASAAFFSSWSVAFVLLSVSFAVIGGLLQWFCDLFDGQTATWLATNLIWNLFLWKAVSLL